MHGKEEVQAEIPEVKTDDLTSVSSCMTSRSRVWLSGRTLAEHAQGPSFHSSTHVHMRAHTQMIMCFIRLSEAL